MKHLLRITLALGVVFALTLTTTISMQAEPTPSQIRKPDPPQPPAGGSNGNGKTYTRTGNTFTIKGVSFTMVKVQGGTFTMGATAEQKYEAFSNEEPAHDVTLTTYYLSKTEVTQGLWKKIMGYNPSDHQGDNLPVENVSWYDAQRFIYALDSITGLNFRLPTEAEWEFAARGGVKSKGFKYSGSNNLNAVAWHNDNSYKTRRVGSKSPNELGIYDMSGNVWEWCQDRFGDYSSEPQNDPIGSTDGTISDRVIRGGSANGFGDILNPATDYRVSIREPFEADARRSFIGFRLAL